MAVACEEWAGARDRICEMEARLAFSADLETRRAIHGRIATAKAHARAVDARIKAAADAGDPDARSFIRGLVESFYDLLDEEED